MRRGRLLWLFALLLGGCRAKPDEPESRARMPLGSVAVVGAPESKPKQADKQARTEPESYRFPAAARLVAIGDLHGDLSAARAALRLAGAIDASDRWIGGHLVVVQTGDQLDRGDQERQIVDLLESLDKQALAKGGRVHALNGNHEIMNVQGDFRYVTPGGLAFGAVSPAAPASHEVPVEYLERARAFLPGGAYARILARRNVVTIVGDSAFVHGGILPEHVAYGLGRVNREVSEWMLGKRPNVPESVTSENSLVWTRAYGGDESEEVCALARRVLGELGVVRLVVGHTVQKGGISSICEDAVWRIDVGLADYYGDLPDQVLEIANGKARPLVAPK